jgi:hypothetical protein
VTATHSPCVSFPRGKIKELNPLFSEERKAPLFEFILAYDVSGSLDDMLKLLPVHSEGTLTDKSSRTRAVPRLGLSIPFTRM